MELPDTQLFNYLILPLLIAVARIFDVSIGTIRIISVSRGHKLVSAILGFFEILVWLVVINKVMTDATNVFAYIGYAGGFAAGSAIGIWMEEKLAVGNLIVRVITRSDPTALINKLRLKGYGVTKVIGHGQHGEVDLVFAVIKRSNLEEVVGIINRFNPKAFYSVEDVKVVRQGVFPQRQSHRALARPLRKGK
ncbi:hypothetical protein STSP2_00731 [Anaerohalosphaera lusitana]|uniref:UPF0316 protein STSP2_00731 n=1 Tax=Anaerohalosphaera lusitana TaxID=1936003 RepID=A0A1U9NI30_9BACT|nr:DUF2179 domain-containing protein [Anaerohalosphaera lusitana]AQT67583.1 hypothetical protein STSP2_00731 [Anaerohalosphaera lusitana]